MRVVSWGYLLQIKATAMRSSLNWHFIPDQFWERNKRISKWVFPPAEYLGTDLILWGLIRVPSPLHTHCGFGNEPRRNKLKKTCLLKPANSFFPKSARILTRRGKWWLKKQQLTNKHQVVNSGFISFHCWKLSNSIIFLKKLLSMSSYRIWAGLVGRISGN